MGAHSPRTRTLRSPVTRHARRWHSVGIWRHPITAWYAYPPPRDILSTPSSSSSIARFLAKFLSSFPLPPCFASSVLLLHSLLLLLPSSVPPLLRSSRFLLFLLCFSLSFLPSFSSVPTLPLFSFFLSPLGASIRVDQRLRAKGVGDTDRTNPNLWIRRRYRKLYEDFRPDVYGWRLLLIARKAALAVVSIMFHGNPTLQVPLPSSPPHLLSPVIRLLFVFSFSPFLFRNGPPRFPSCLSMLYPLSVCFLAVERCISVVSKWFPSPIRCFRVSRLRSRTLSSFRVPLYRCALV